MMLDLGIKDIIGIDRTGILYRGREDMNSAKHDYAQITNPDNIKGTLSDAMEGADLFVGLSGPGILTVEHLKKMNAGAIVFAMSNPTPEILPELAWPHIAVMATGRSDYPNQLNNVLCFPGIFRGALDCRATRITEAMKMAERIASLPPVQVRMCKRDVDVAAKALNHAVSFMDLDQYALSQSSNDYQEGVASFLEKRPPNWTGS